MTKFHNIDLYTKYLQYSEGRSNNLINYINDQFHSTEINQCAFLEKIIIGSLISGCSDCKIKPSEIKKYVQDEKKRKKDAISKYKKIAIPLMVPLYFVFEFGVAEPLMEHFVNHKSDGTWTPSGAASEFIEEYEEKTWQAWAIMGACLASGLTGFALRLVPERMYNKNQEALDALYEASKKKQFKLEDIIDLYIALVEDNFIKNADINQIAVELNNAIINERKSNEVKSVKELERLASSLREKLFARGDNTFKKDVDIENLFIEKYLQKVPKEESLINKCVSFIGWSSAQKVEPNSVV